jgi:hypothetical protein
MRETIQYPYSKKSGYAGLAIMLIFILLLGRTWTMSYLVHDVPGMVIFGLFILVILSIMGIMIYTRLIPALKGEVALELDENGVKDYIRNIILDWKDVEDIGLKPGRSSAMLIFELKFDSDFGKRVAVGLRWVEGRDRDIYDTVLAYFDDVEGIIRVEEVNDDDEADM